MSRFPGRIRIRRRPRFLRRRGLLRRGICQRREARAGERKIVVSVRSAVGGRILRHSVIGSEFARFLRYASGPGLLESGFDTTFQQSRHQKRVVSVGGRYGSHREDSRLNSARRIRHERHGRQRNFFPEARRRTHNELIPSDMSIKTLTASFSRHAVLFAAASLLGLSSQAVFADYAVKNLDVNE